jgi:1-deoxy-D-xylulose-5-phosphate reductoisomerase
MRKISVLGSTGSIGLSTLDVVSRHPDRFAVHALAAARSVDRLAEQCVRFRPARAVLADQTAAADLRERLRQADCPTEILSGPDALSAVAADPEVDVVMAAIVGAAGLPSALAAARAGKVILLANKESLVMAGPVFLAAARAGGATVLPIDSEHNAVFQCLPQVAGSDRGGVRRILLTASGGPFRRATIEQMDHATPEQAVAHPKWSMGRKISVDSATMMNKGLEVIEAHYLFGLPSSAIDVVVHPQSVVHSMVEYVDGSVLAQLGHPDMRTPIAHAMGFPERIASGVASLDLTRAGSLEFEPPDPERFPCLRLAREALDEGGAAPCVLNAANEMAVQAFLDGLIGFTSIARINEQVLGRLGRIGAPADLDAVLAADRQARDCASVLISSGSRLS